MHFQNVGYKESGKESTLGLRMVNIVRTKQSSGGGSPPRAAEVGEIDTKAPFQSVRAAVTLFGETSSTSAPSTSPKSGSNKPVFTKRSKSHVEGVLDKEGQFHLALNELNKLKELLRGAESTKAETLPQLQQAQRTLNQLQLKLKTVNDSKQSILEATEVVKSKATLLQQAASTHDDDDDDVPPPSPSPSPSPSQSTDSNRDAYLAAVAELDAAKQELSNLRRDFDEAMAAKLAASRRCEAAHTAGTALKERVSELSNQVSTMHEALSNINISSQQAALDHATHLAQKDVRLQSCKLVKQELDEKLLSLRQHHQPLLSEFENHHLVAQLADSNAEIASLQDAIAKAQAACLEAHNKASSELEIAKEKFKHVEDEKTSLESLVESLKLQLERVGKELSEQKHKEEAAQALVGRLQAELEDKRIELEAGLVNKTSAADASDDMVSTLEQLALETEKAKQEAQQMREMREELKKEAALAEQTATDLEAKLSILLQETQVAKSAEAAAREEIKTLSAEPDSHASTNGKVKLSKDEYDSLIAKINESNKLAEIKVADAMAHVEALITNQKEAAINIEAGIKELEDLKAAEEEALKTAQLAEADTRAMEAELHHFQQQLDTETTNSKPPA